MKQESLQSSENSARPLASRNVLGVILARGGSKGLKDKHLVPLLGRKVIEYTFDAAQSARLLTHIIVSTDSLPILELAHSYDIDALHRPESLASDDASVQDVMLHAMQHVEKERIQTFDALVVLYGNIPVRPDGAIDQAIELLLSSGCDSVRSFCPVGKWHPQWMVKLDGDKVTQLAANMGHRRQDLTPLYLHDGAALAISRSSMLRGLDNPQDPHAFFGQDRRGIPTPADGTVEIDQQRDLYWAEAVLRSRHDQARRVA